MVQPVLHYYAADQNPEKTSSLGIYNVTRCLLQALASQPMGPWKLVVSVNPKFRKDLIPDPCPEWIEVVEVSGKRLWLDHIWCPYFTHKIKADAILYPKGFISLIRPRGIQIFSIVYDCMNDYYAEVYPGFKPWQIRYFRFLMKRTLRFSNEVFTISDFSRSEILRRYPFVQKVHVLPMGLTVGMHEMPLPRSERKGFLVFGTQTPHKRTRETLELFQMFRKETEMDEPLFLTGFSDVPEDLLPGVVKEGYLTPAELSKRLGSVRAVLLLSEMEGFGLPILEAYSHETPVVFRNQHSFHEVLGDEIPGAWDGENVDSFIMACQAVLVLEEEVVKEIGVDLNQRYAWDAAGNIVREVITRKGTCVQNPVTA